MKAKDFISSLALIQQNYSNGIPKREIFSLAKEYQFMQIPEVVKLLQDQNHNHRTGAIAILDWKARNNKTSLDEKKDIYNAYMDNHAWIDDWGLVDRAAPYVIGGYLFDQDRKPLYELARSVNPMERRTAIVSTYFFIRKNDLEDTFTIAEMLVHDSDEYVQKAVGSWIREAGKKDESKLLSFLDKYATTMPRITLRYAIEKLDRPTKDHYLALKKSK